MTKEPAMIMAVVVAVVNLAVLYGLLTADAAPLWNSYSQRLLSSS